MSFLPFPSTGDWDASLPSLTLLLLGEEQEGTAEVPCGKGRLHSAQLMVSGTLTGRHLCWVHRAGVKAGEALGDGCSLLGPCATAALMVHLTAVVTTL